MKIDSRHHGRRVALLIDLVSSLLTLPFYYTFNYSIGCFFLTTGEKKNTSNIGRARDTLLVGPLLLTFSFALLPLAFHGWLLWLLLNILAPSRPFSAISSTTTTPNAQKHQTSFTFASMNVLLGAEIVNKFNNLGSTFARLREISDAILDQSSTVLDNVSEWGEKLSKEQAILAKFPHIDFICFQEVFDRLQGLALARRLRSKYPHFILDVADHRLSNNLCMLASGLAIASRFPFLDVKFVPFTAKRGWHWCGCNGVLMCKMDLGEGRVGILANLHMVAYQGKEQLIALALTHVEEAIDEFRKEVVRPNESLEWEVIGGDYNCDNMSPGDRACADHPIFSNFKDPAMVRPGKDAAWAVGTEPRQPTLHTPEMRNPDHFREILVDDVRRRHYVLDAVVEEQTFDLMTIGPTSNKHGEVVTEEWGGMRRIDKLLFRCGSNFETTNRDQSCFRGSGVLAGAGTVSALAGRTDHIPVVLTLKTQT